MKFGKANRYSALMKALVLKQHGSLDDVNYVDLPIPEVGQNDVLIKVKAAALNHLDLWVVAGWRGLQLRFPHTLGCDGSGIVSQIGPGVSGFDIGDRVSINPTYSCGQCFFCHSGRDNMCDNFAVFGEHIPGFFSEYQLVPSGSPLKIPDTTSHEIAAAASLVYVTAWLSLVGIGQLRLGGDILIIGAGGGVNTASIQIAKLAGAGTIYVVGSSEKKLEVARNLGADVTINRLNEDWGKAVFEATGRKGVDIVVDNVGADTFHLSLRSLRKGGRLLTVGNTSGPKIQIDNRYVFGKHLKILGSTMGPKQDYKKVMNMVFSGHLIPTIDSVYPLRDGIAALRQLESGDYSGKLVLRL